MRASQTTLAARKAGHSVHVVVGLNETHAERRVFNDKMHTVSIFTTPEQLRDSILMTQPDVIHVHDRPHELAAEVIKLRLGIPVVVDVHDMDSVLVSGFQNPAEAQSLIEADGLVFVSEQNRKYAIAKYDPLPPSIVVHSTVLSDLFPLTRMPRISAAVWEGGLYTEDPPSPRAYIDQREIVARFNAVGQSTILFPAEDLPGVAPVYRAAGGLVLPGMALPPLIEYLTRFEFGWYGQTTDHQQIHDTIPNKLFEMVAAGLPVLVINAREAGKFVEEHGLGIHVEKPEDIVRVKDRLMALRPQIWQKRYEFTREKSCFPLWALYEQAIEAKKVAQAVPQGPEPFVLQL
jgi:glycosyltransferase involved in cell wall biosynthesis